MKTLQYGQFLGINKKEVSAIVSVFCGGAQCVCVIAFDFRYFIKIKLNSIVQFVD